MNPSTMELIATICFALAVIHTFVCGFFQKLANQTSGFMRQFFHFFGEVELVFIVWSAIMLLAQALLAPVSLVWDYVKTVDPTEPVFVLVIMIIAASKPILELAQKAMAFFARLLPLRSEMATYLACMIIGPLAGSFITEPAAMTVTALFLRDQFLKNKSKKFIYISLATLFVNVSVGGVLTNFAAPPVLMVAAKWQWSLRFMFFTFGWKAICIVTLNAILAAFQLRHELFSLEKRSKIKRESPWWMSAIHILFLGLTVYFAHSPLILLALLFAYLLFWQFSKSNQSPLIFKTAGLVAVFLLGLVILGNFQGWWLRPLMSLLNPTALFVGTTALTAITDNAALTYLGAQLPNLSESFQYFLVAGAVTGGGLTVIANAPNPAGLSILSGSFAEEGFDAIQLIRKAAMPTVISAVVFYVLSFV